MADVSRTRTNIVTITAYIQSTIQAKNASWFVRAYPYPDVDNILKYLSTTQTQNGAVLIVYAGSPFYATLENTSPSRKLNYKLILCYQKYSDPSAGALYLQGMIDSVISALDWQILNGKTGFFIARDTLGKIGNNGNGVLTSTIDINVEDN